MTSDSSPASRPGPQPELPASPWDLTLAWTTRVAWVLFAADVILALLGEWSATWSCAAGSGFLVCAVTVMAHLSCQCGGSLLRRAGAQWRVTREGERVHVCRECAAGHPASPSAGECCPHGVPWASWPCGQCEYPQQGS